MDLSGKVALVTGAGAGLGLKITERLVKRGAAVLAVDIDPANLEAMSARLTTHQAFIETFAGDVSDPAEVDAMTQYGQDRLGAFDILVNNAAIMDQDQGVGEVDVELWHKVVAINLSAPMLLMRRIVPRMIAHKSGSIVNIASSAGLRGAAAGAAYTASKHALIGLTKNTAWLYGARGVRCNAVAPGGMDTNMTAPAADHAAADGEALASVRSSMPDTLRPCDVAEVVAFLASDVARALNGAVIAADAGWTAA